MATTTAIQAGLSRAAYNEKVEAARAAVKDASDKAALAAYKDSLAKTQEHLTKTQALLKVLRQVHVDFIDSDGADYVAGALGEIDYYVGSLKRSVTDYETRICRLESTDPVAENDE